MDQQLNPAMIFSDENFDTFKDKVKFLMHSTSIYPSNLVDLSIKLMFDLDEDTRISVPHYRASHISKYIYFGPSMVKATIFHFFS